MAGEAVSAQACLSDKLCPNMDKKRPRIKELARRLAGVTPKLHESRLRIDPKSIGAIYA